MKHSQTLPYASSLCGACYEVCPVKINIPEILIHLRHRVVEDGDAPWIEKMAMKAASYVLESPEHLDRARKLGRIAQRPFATNGVISHLPFGLDAWTGVRDLPALPDESFREWWVKRERETGR
jgi:L-lactate dehydrogenase complex protein LldF